MRRTRRGLNPKLTITEARETDNALWVVRVSEVLVNTLTGTDPNYYGAIFMLGGYLSQEGRNLI